MHPSSSVQKLYLPNFPLIVFLLHRLLALITFGGTMKPPFLGSVLMLPLTLANLTMTIVLFPSSLNLGRLFRLTNQTFSFD